MRTRPKVVSFKKDFFANRWLTKLFMPGTIHFSQSADSVGKSELPIYVTGVGLQSLDNETFALGTHATH